jgi:nucleoside-diphosphate-sugar epimerase
MAKVLVTGATGFIGKHLIPKLRANQHDVTEVNRIAGDIADDATWAHLPHAEVVIHLAGRAYVPDSWNEPAGFLKTNLHGTVCALEYCKKHNARMVFLSSYMYGKPEKLPIPESASLQANNPYALSKKLAEEVCRFYADFFGVKIIVFRPFNIYGPGQARHFLIPSIIDQVAEGNEVHVKDLEPKRDYVYVDDVAEAITMAVEIDKDFDILNIGTGISYSVAEVIDLIQKIKGTNLVVRSGGERRPAEIMDTQADITKASDILGWSPKWTLRAGLQQMLVT